jgi:hypothetical protein
MKAKKILLVFLVVVLLSLLVTSTAFAKGKPDDCNQENNGNGSCNGNGNDNGNGNGNGNGDGNGNANNNSGGNNNANTPATTSTDGDCDENGNKKTECDKAILKGKRLNGVAKGVEHSGNVKLAEKYLEWQIEYILGVLEACDLTPDPEASPVPY